VSRVPGTSVTFFCWAKQLIEKEAIIKRIKGLICSILAKVVIKNGAVSKAITYPQAPQGGVLTN
jgi:hypothetical protein